MFNLLPFFVPALLAVGATDKSFFESELIFPPEGPHNHASCIVECPNGDLLVCWYHGSGERKADDVIVEGARKQKGQKGWSSRFLLADQPGFPDTNPCLFVDPQKRLWLFWNTIVANEWHSALLRGQVSSNYQEPGAPKWERSDVILIKPGEEFVKSIERATIRELGNVPADHKARWQKYADKRLADARDKYSRRMGWMTRVHPFVLADRSWILPLYSDGFSVSIMALTDDAGITWNASEPLVGGAGIQPSLVQKKDGTLLAFMRDNGPPPKRILVSESRDKGKTWGPNVNSDLPNPGAGIDIIKLRDGAWALIYNDLEKGRHNLAVSLSLDEGKTWKYTRHLESSPADANGPNGHYPSMIQGADGTLHATYTYSLRGKKLPKDANGRPLHECIKYAQFDEDWIKQGDPYEK
jgi:predicted neuraminidase